MHHHIYSYFFINFSTISKLELIMEENTDICSYYRLFVSNIPAQAQVCDIKRELTTIFTKLTIVEEIYIPSPTMTGIFRNFAIVRIFSTSELKNECIKAFNGCYVLGCKIHVEMCRNMFYKEKLDLERIATKSIL